MKVVLYMAVSTDGYIAKENDDTSWISSEEWAFYSKFIQDAGNLVVGHRTYEILTNQPEFSELKDVQLVVISHKNFETLASNHIVVNSAKEALKSLEKYNTVVVAGGGQLNSSFLKENLIDEIYLDVEPIILGNGIKLFGEYEAEVNLKLLEMKKISESELQLHYEILK
jgi:dihydrofolate reductase